MIGTSQFVSQTPPLGYWYCSYTRDLGQIGILGGNWHFFQVGLQNSLYKKIVNKYLKQKRNNDSDCNFYDFSLLLPQPNKFVVVCICIVIFHGIHSPLPTNIFLWGAKYFFVSCSQGLGILQSSWGPSALGGPNFLFQRRGARPFSSIKPSMTNHVNSRTVDGKIICFKCACKLFKLLLCNFLFENFLSLQVSIETPKKVFTTVRY